MRAVVGIHSSQRCYGVDSSFDGSHAEQSKCSHCGTPFRLGTGHERIASGCSNFGAQCKFEQ